MPTTDPSDPASFDYPLLEKLFDAYLDAGFTYFDTAYTYHGYHAEEGVRRALVERHPRDSFQLATKLPLRDFDDMADMARIFDKQLAACGVEFFDFYLLHNMGTNVYAKCCECDAFGFIARKKEEGFARQVGLSFHDTPELLDEVLASHGSALDFVQLQVNYADWNQPNVQSRRCLEVAAKHNLPVIVMEPCKGGTLVNVPEEAVSLMRAYDPNASVASWALRFAASQPGVVRVLSGMNALEQVQDNAATFTNFKPLSSEEVAIVDQVRTVIEANTAIPCTACEYCTHDCPSEIAIPRYFALYNSAESTTGGFSSQQVYYNNTALKHGKAADCVGCGACEDACPQHLPIIDLLQTVSAKFDGAALPGLKSRSRHA